MICSHKSKAQAIWAHGLCLLIGCVFIGSLMNVSIHLLSLGQYPSTKTSAILFFVVMMLFVGCLLLLRLFPREIIFDKNNRSVKVCPYLFPPTEVDVSCIRKLREYGSIYSPNDWFRLLFSWKYGFILLGDQQYSNVHEFVKFMAW